MSSDVRVRRHNSELYDLELPPVPYPVEDPPKWPRPSRRAAFTAAAAGLLALLLLRGLGGALRQSPAADEAADAGKRGSPALEPHAAAAAAAEQAAAAAAADGAGAGAGQATAPAAAARTAAHAGGLPGGAAGFAALPAALATAAAKVTAAAGAEAAARRWRHPLQQAPGLPPGPEEPGFEPPPPGPGGQGHAGALVRCATTAGPIAIQVNNHWAPRGAERFLDMVRNGFFGTRVALFRSVPGFLCQTGVAGDPAGQRLWEQKGAIEDDRQWLQRPDQGRAMKRGYLSFAGSGPNSRKVEFFFAYRDIGLGSSPWEVPFGTLVGQESFQTMDHWYTGYGDLQAFGGRAPSQQAMHSEGIHYLHKQFPDLDYITSCDIAS